MEGKGRGGGGGGGRALGLLEYGNLRTGRKGETDEIEMELPEGTDGPAGSSEPGERLKRDRMDAKESFTLLPPPALSNYALAEMGEYRFQNI